MAENVEFLIDAQYPNRRAVEDFLKDVKEIKATLASFGKEARAVKALSTSVASLNKSLAKKVSLADAAAKAELQAQKAATEAARTRAANAKAAREEEKAAQERQKTLQQRLKTQQQLIERGEKARAKRTRQQVTGTAAVTQELQKQAFVTKKLSTAAERLAKSRASAFGAGLSGSQAFGAGVPGGGGGKDFNFRTAPVLEELGAPSKDAESAAKRFRKEMERSRGAVRRAAAETKKLAAGTAAAAKSARASRGQFQLLNGTIGRSIRSVGALAAIFTALEGIKLGTAFADQLVQARAQIAGLIASSARLVDSTGDIVGPAEAYPRLLSQANGQIEKLQKNALETASTFGQLLENFQTAIGPGLAAGLNVDQIRELTVQISQAATAIGLEQRQLAEEVRSLFTGAINPRNSRIATVLGITPDQVKEARKAGKLAEFLEERLEGITTAAGDLQNTLLVTFSNLGDQLQQVAGDAFEPFREKLIELAGVISDSLGAGGVGNDFLQGLGIALARGAELATNFVKNLDREKLELFGNAVREVAGFLTTLAGAILPGVGAGFLLVAVAATAVARTLQPIVDSEIGRALLASAVTAAVFAKALLSIRAAYLAARAAALAFQTSIPVVGIALAAAAAAAGAYYLASEEMEASNLDAADSFSEIDDKVQELMGSMDQFFSTSIDQAGDFAKAMKSAADQVKRLQTASERAVAREGRDAGFRDALGQVLDLPEPNVAPLRAARTELKSLREELLEVANAADAAELSEDVARGLLERFRDRTVIGLGSSAEGAQLSGELAATRAERLDLDKKGLALTQAELALVAKIADLETQIKNQVAERTRKEAQALSAIEPRLQRQARLRRDETRASIRAAEEELKANVGRPDGLAGSEQADLERKIALIEREVSLKAEQLTISDLLAKGRALEAAGEAEGAAAAFRLAQAAQGEFDLREELFKLTDKLRKLEGDRLKIQEESEARLDEQARKLRAIDAVAGRLDTAADLASEEGRLKLQEAAQRLRVRSAQQNVDFAKDELQLAKDRGASQDDINELRDRELDATEALIAATSRLNALIRQGVDAARDRADALRESQESLRLLEGESFASSLDRTAEAAPESERLKLQAAAQKVRVGLAREELQLSREAIERAKQRKASQTEINQLRAEELQKANALADAQARLTGLNQAEKDRVADAAKALRISEQSLKLRQQEALASRLDSQSQFAPLAEQFKLQELAQQTRIDGARQQLALAREELALAKSKGEDQLLINQLRGQELDAAQALVDSETRLQELRQREAERTQIGAGAFAGLRDQQQGQGEIANQAVQASINAFRSGLQSAVAAAFDPNQSQSLAQVVGKIGIGIGQAVTNAIIEAAIVQPIITAILGTQASSAAVTSLAIKQGFTLGSLFAAKAIVTAFKVGAGFAAAAGGFNKGGVVGRNSGGVIPGFDSGGTVGAPNLTRAPAGLHHGDRVLAALTPGEGVLNKGAMRMLGTDWLNAVNRDFGKVSVGRPRRAGKIQGFNSGGVVAGGGGGARPSIRGGGGGSSILVADRETARILLRNRAFDERAVSSRRTLKAL